MMGNRTRNNPSGRYFSVKDLPEALQNALRAVGYSRKGILVEPQKTYCVASPHSGEGMRGFTVAVDLVTGETRATYGSWGGANYFEQKQVDLDLAQRPLPYNGAVIHGGEGGGRPVYAMVYVHPDNLQKLLPAGDQEPLTEREEQALEAIAHYITKGRHRKFDDHDLGEYGPQNPLVQSLAAKGLVTITGKAIQVTLEGRNRAMNLRNNPDGERGLVARFLAWLET